LAGLRKLSESGRMDADASVVAILTGHVLKDTDFIIKRHNKQSMADAHEPAGVHVH
jgi:threonine synthase